MKGNDAVIAKLNEALREELTAINQYFVHAEMCHNWGYHRLGNYMKKQSIGEMKHAEEVLESIKAAREAGDNGSADLFERLLKDEEEHVDFLEAQMHQIAQLGYERYLGQQLEGSESK